MGNLKKCFIMGLPCAGKTTYLGALWYSLFNATQKNMIKLDVLTGNAKYLADLSKRWANAEELDRTLLGYEKIEISINVKDEYGNKFNLQFPDLSGETFQNGYVKREISNELVEHINLADGILMFINISNINHFAFISDNNDSPSNIDENGQKGENITRNPHDDPTQVQIIELLQFIATIRQNNSTNLGIVLSAWDLKFKKIKPEEFVKKQMNMLWQFLESNRNIFKSEYWGVSALGAKIEETDYLLSKEEPMDRIIVEDNRGHVTNDITLPIFKVVGE